METSVSNNPNGRPKARFDLPELRPTWRQDIISLYAQGGADVEVWTLIWTWRGTFSNDLWERWMEEEPLFSETVKEGREICKAWWVSRGRGSLYVDKFQNGLYALHMKNRFGWKDKKEVENTGQPLQVQVVDFSKAAPPEAPNNS